MKLWLLLTSGLFLTMSMRNLIFLRRSFSAFKEAVMLVDSYEVVDNEEVSTAFATWSTAMRSLSLVANV